MTAPYTPCDHDCANCHQADCMCAGGDGRYKRCAHGCNDFGKRETPRPRKPGRPARPNRFNKHRNR